MAFVVSANTAGVMLEGIPSASADGGSEVLDFQGRVLARADVGPSIAACAEVDVAALRRARRRAGMHNLRARHRPSLYAAVYAEANGHPGGALAKGASDRRSLLATQAATIERLDAAGVL